MKRLFIQLGLAIGFGLGLLTLMLGLMAHQAQAMPDSLKLQQVNEDGFGDIMNKQLPSLAIFGDYLYAGTWRYDEQGDHSASIWRTSNGQIWEMVDDRPVNGAAHMIVFNDSIYAGSWDGTIWSSMNGITWTEIITDGFDGTNQGIAHFAVYSDTLYASTWYSGTEIWRTTNGTSWEPFVEGGLGDLNNGGAIASEIFDMYLYFGVTNWVSGAQLWRTDGITITAVITAGFGTIENGGVSSLAFFRDDLYAGICNYNQGIQVLRSNNGLDWEDVTDGFTHPETGCMNSLEVYRDKLYLVIQNDESGVEVWRTPNGTEWEQVGFGGFGDPANTEIFWDNGTLVFKDKLYTGVRNWPTGGEVWQISDPYINFLPFLNK